VVHRFTLVVEYAEAEFAAYQRALNRRDYGEAGLTAWETQATGGLSAISGSLLVFSTGLASVEGANLVAVLVFAAFLLGMFSPGLWYARRRRAILRAYPKWSFLVASRGIFTRTDGARGFFARSGFTAVTVGSGLLMLWRGQEHPLAIPLRLLTPDQKAELLAFAQRAKETSVGRAPVAEK
jgi:hypothetical protein